jgi:hypothetical protein
MWVPKLTHKRGERITFFSLFILKHTDGVAILTGLSTCKEEVSFQTRGDFSFSKQFLLLAGQSGGSGREVCGWYA